MDRLQLAKGLKAEAGGTRRSSDLLKNYRYSPAEQESLRHAYESDDHNSFLISRWVSLYKVSDPSAFLRSLRVDEGLFDSGTVLCAPRDGDRQGKTVAGQVVVPRPGLDKATLPIKRTLAHDLPYWISENVAIVESLLDDRNFGRTTSEA
jgi:hypothetical protein